MVDSTLNLTKKNECKKLVNGYNEGVEMETKLYNKISRIVVVATAIILVGLSANAQNRQQILSSELLKSTAVAVYEKDSSQTYRWNSTTSAYDNLWKNIYAYNKSGNISQIDYLLWDTSSKKWTSKWREVYTYNTSAQLTECEFLEYNATSKAWVSSQVFTYNYNGAVLLSCLVENWDAAASKFVNWRFDSFVYDLNGRQKEYKIDYWDATTQTWVSSLRNTPVYNNGGLLDQEVSELWSKTSSNWSNLSSDVYTYNAQNQKTQLLKRTWDTSSSATWVPTDKFTYLYTSNLVTTTTQFKYIAATSTYDNAAKILYKYDSNGNVTEEVQQTFNATTAGWDNTSRQLSYWSKSAVGTALLTPETQELVVYPNPAINEIHITGTTESSTVTIYDYAGRVVVMIPEYTSGNSIDLSSIAKGIYIVKAGTQVSKFEKR
jgi:hypothetical protein